MKVIIDKNLCKGCELCVNICTDVFIMWGAYLKPVFDVKDPEKYGEAVKKAALECPYKAITVVDSNSSNQ